MRGLQFITICVIGSHANVWAFRPTLPRQRRNGLRYMMFSSSPTQPSMPSPIGTFQDTKSPVRVVDVNDDKISKGASQAYLESSGKTARMTADDSYSTTNNKADSVESKNIITSLTPIDDDKEAKVIKKTTGTKKPSVVTATCMQELLDVMNGDFSSTNIDNNDERLTLILFHAHYCKICQRATMQLNKAAKEYPSVHFAKVESKVFPEPAADNLRTLGVSKFPFVQIYRKGQCVASFSTGPTHMFMRKVRDTLDLCLDRDEACWDSFVTEFAELIKSNEDARRNLGPLP